MTAATLLYCEVVIMEDIGSLYKAKTKYMNLMYISLL